MIIGQEEMEMEDQRNTFIITDYGVSTNSEKNQTKAIQSCIDACRKAGGGEVIIPEGDYLIGSLRLYSNITLRLKSGAILRESQNLADYCDFQVPSTINYLHDEYYKKIWHLPEYYFYAMITAFKEENVKIIGEPGSLIDGQDTFDENGEEGFRGPMGIVLSQITGVHLAGYCFKNSANWSHTIDGCQNVQINNVIIEAGHDGFNLHHSTNIYVRDCHLACGDDCFAGYDIEQLMVEDCFLNTACNAMRIGGDTIIFKNCRYQGPGRYPHLSENTYYTHAIFKYYAIEADTIQKDAQNIRLIDCKIADADKFLVYEYGEKKLMQNNRPLRQLLIENCSISGIRKTSNFFGNGEQVRLQFKNLKIDYTGEACFLRVDESVQLELQQVEFLNPTKIEIGKNQVIELQGLITQRFFKGIDQ